MSHHIKLFPMFPSSPQLIIWRFNYWRRGEKLNTRIPCQNRFNFILSDWREYVSGKSWKVWENLIEIFFDLVRWVTKTLLHKVTNNKETSSIPSNYGITTEASIDKHLILTSARARCIVIASSAAKKVHISLEINAELIKCNRRIPRLLY